MNATTSERGSAPAAAPVRAKGQAAREHSVSTMQRSGKMDRSARFWDRIAARYARKPVADEAAYQKKLAVTRGYLRPNMEVLELGCGTGSTAIAHAPHVKHIRATDISAKMLDIARRKAEAAGIANITVQQSTVEEVDVPAGSVDVVLALSLLHLLDDRDTAVAKVHSMLKPGGLFVSNTVCLGGSFHWFRPIAPIGRALGLLPLVRFFSKEELHESLERAGFEIEHSWQPAKGKAVFIVARKTA